MSKEKSIGEIMTELMQPFIDCVENSKVPDKPNKTPMPECKPPKERRSTDLDPAKKFQCEMAERILISLIDNPDIPHHTDLSIEISEGIYKHFFKQNNV